MATAKKIREKGKIRLSRYFTTFSEGDRVSVVAEKSVSNSFPKRLQGRSGVVMGKRGSHAVIKLKDKNKEKTFIIHPVHLKKL